VAREGGFGGVAPFAQRLKVRPYQAKIGPLLNWLNMVDFGGLLTALSTVFLLIQHDRP
jgi:hypothetical protein